MQLSKQLHQLQASRVHGHRMMRSEQQHQPWQIQNRRQILVMTHGDLALIVKEHRQQRQREPIALYRDRQQAPGRWP